MLRPVNDSWNLAIGIDEYFCLAVAPVSTGVGRSERNVRARS